MNENFIYRFQWVDHFFKYTWTLPIKNKDKATFRNTITQVFIMEYPEILQTGNRKELVNKELLTYLDNIKVENVLGTAYRQQSQGGFKAF